MKLTLRKANALQLLINEKIAATTLATAVSVSRYDDPCLLVISAAANLQESLSKKRLLLEVLYSIRQAASAANQSSGISDILSEVAYIDKLTAALKPLAENSQFSPAEEVLREAHADLKKEVAPVGYGSRRDAFTTGFIPQGWADGYVKEVSDLRKRKQSLSDKLLELNISNEIELSDQEEEVLKKYDLI